MTDKQQQLDTIRHSLAHILAAAICQMYPSAQFGVGPTVENGFYYDIFLEDQTISNQELAKIEDTMNVLIKGNHDFTREEWSLVEAKRYFAKNKQDFKVELINDLTKHGTTKASDINVRELGIKTNDEKITSVTVYKTGDFVDLCLGPHVANTKELANVAFHLTKVSGAYWRGDEKRPQMQRIYGVGFLTQAKLNDYLAKQVEAEKRDHRKLGRELDLFTFSDLVGSGLPLYTPRGTIIRTELQRALSEISQNYDMQPVITPHLGKLELYEISGHADKFANELFYVKSHYNQEFVLKPVSCPHHTQIYAARPRSWRDLPLRLVESAMQYRDEKPGEIGGLARTRGFTVDDGHTFARQDQIKEEVDVIVKVIREFYEMLDLWGHHWVSLSVRDLNNLHQYIGEISDWDEAEKILADVSRQQNLDAKRMEGEAALYGPKLDFMFEDGLGRQTQLATIQLDFAMPKRFELTYTDQDGKPKHPIMIHRAILGSFERFMMLLIEHYGGAFPVWLAPEQVRIITISEKEGDYAEKITTVLTENNIRHHLDGSGQSLGKRIREAEISKIPYTLILGGKEAKADTVAVRHHTDGDQGSMKLSDFIARINTQIFERQT